MHALPQADRCISLSLQILVCALIIANVTTGSQFNKSE